MTAHLIGTCERCKVTAELYPSPSPVYVNVCAPCGNGDNAGMVSR